MAPKCCGRDASWIVINPRSEYWFCKECRNEVKVEGRKEFARRISDTKLEPVKTPHHLTQEEIDELFANISSTSDSIEFNPLTGYWQYGMKGVPDETC